MSLNKLSLILLLVLFFTVPFSRNAFAAGICNNLGTTVVLVNGIFTSEDDAKANLNFLEEKYLEYLPDSKNINFILGYNPSHIAGLGDVAQAVTQALDAPMSTFDRDTILMQIHKEIETQKILLLGHSQGTFYTNEIYKYLINNGVPTSSVNVYNLATPASSVAGSGKYLTSTNDKLIQTVRNLALSAKTSLPLSANITIPLSNKNDTSMWAGHSFRDEYLKGAPSTIISAINSQIGKLKSSEVVLEDGCFTPPTKNLTYIAQQASFFVLDSFANVAISSGSAVIKIAQKTTSTITDGVFAMDKMMSKLFSKVGEALTSTTVYTAGQGASVIQSVDESFENETLDLLANQPVLSGAVLEEDIQKPVVNVVKQEVAIKKENKITDTEVIQTDNDNDRTTNKTEEIEENIETDSGGIHQELFSVPFFGGGGGGTSVQEDEETETELEPEPEPQTEEDEEEVVEEPVLVYPDAPTIISPTNGLWFRTTSILFIGTSTPNLVIHNNFGISTTTSDENGNWSITLNDFLEGIISLVFWAEDSDELASDNVSVDVNVDITAPAIPILEIFECNYSLSTTSCVTAGSTATLSWSTASTDISYYTIEQNGLIVATTTSSTYPASLTNDTYGFAIGAYDNAGNSATSTIQSIEKIENPLVINEIAWAGTEADVSHEWIEIYNKSGRTIDLSNIVLYAEDFVPYINLSGSVFADGYYLIERGNSNTTSVSENLAVEFNGLNDGSGLSDEGEVLYLAQAFGGIATTTLDQTPALSDCGGLWCAGSSGDTLISMERIYSDIEGSVVGNWASNNTYTKNGTDSGGNNIYGTPKSRNSVSLLRIGFYCRSDDFSYIEPPYVEGGYYIPMSGRCTYESYGFTNRRYGGIYKGEVASSTPESLHSLGKADSTLQQGDELTNPVQGDKYFTVIFETSGATPIMQKFMKFLTTGENPPPHLNYGVINWVYGE